MTVFYGKLLILRCSAAQHSKYRGSIWKKLMVQTSLLLAKSGLGIFEYCVLDIQILETFWRKEIKGDIIRGKSKREET